MVENPIFVRVHVQHEHLGQVERYLQQLNEASRQRFGPHGYTRQHLLDFYSNPYNAGYALALPDGSLGAYAVLRFGFLEHDAARLRGWGLQPDHATDASFAPSVADAWQGKGLGKQLLQWVQADARARGFRRLLLWGGVQASNDAALAYYRRAGFVALGSFDYQGLNWDMSLDL